MLLQLNPFKENIVLNTFSYSLKRQCSFNTQFSTKFQMYRFSFAEVHRCISKLFQQLGRYQSRDEGTNSITISMIELIFLGHSETRYQLTNLRRDLSYTYERNLLTTHT